MKEIESFSLDDLGDTPVPEAIRQVLKKEGKPRNDEEKNYFTGQVFQMIGCYIMRTRLVEGERLLTPEETLAYFTGFYSEATLIERKYGTSSLWEVPVPDGLLFKDGDQKIYDLGQLVAVYEYTVVRNLRAYIKGKKRGFLEFREVFPTLPGEEIELRFVVPLDRETYELEDLIEGMSIERLGFNSHQFHQYLMKFLGPSPRRSR